MVFKDVAFKEALCERIYVILNARLYKNQPLRNVIVDVISDRTTRNTECKQLQFKSLEKLVEKARGIKRTLSTRNVA